MPYLNVHRMPPDKFESYVESLFNLPDNEKRRRLKRIIERDKEYDDRVTDAWQFQRYEDIYHRRSLQGKCDLDY